MSFINLTSIEQKQIIEAIIFSSDEPLSLEQIANLLIFKTNISKNNENETIDNLENHDNSNDIIGMIRSIIETINLELKETNRPFGIIENAGSYQYALLSEYGELLQQVSKHKVKKRLSQATLEVLAIIAYKQPVSKPEIELIRGINSNEIVNTLLDKNLIEISGKSENIGKPLLYSTSNEFLRTFGINHIDELPKLKEFDEIIGLENSNIENLMLEEEKEQKEILENSDFEFIKVVSQKEIEENL